MTAEERQKRNEYQRWYYHEVRKKNPEQIARDRAYHAQWQKDHKEHLSAYRKARRKTLTIKQIEEAKK